MYIILYSSSSAFFNPLYHSDNKKHIQQIFKKIISKVFKLFFFVILLQVGIGGQRAKLQSEGHFQGHTSVKPLIVGYQRFPSFI